MSIKKHIKDIDFRARSVRQSERMGTYKDWYKHLLSQPYSERNQGQLTMLSAVLWHELPKKEYENLVTDKHQDEPTNTELFEEYSEEWLYNKISNL